MVLLTMTTSIVDALELANGHQSRLTTLQRSESSEDVSEAVDDPSTWFKQPATAPRAQEARENVACLADDLRSDGKSASRATVKEEEVECMSADPSLLQPSTGKPISHSQVIDLSRTLRSQGKTAYTLEKLLLGARVYSPPPPPRSEKTSEYKALMSRLRREAEARSYSQMTSISVPPLESFSQGFPYTPTTSPSHAFSATARYMSPADAGDSDVTYADIDRQMAVVLNVLISIVACAAAIWMVARWWSTPARLAVSMGGGGLVGVAECVVYWGYIRRVAEAKKVEGEKTEVREVVETWTIGSEQNETRVEEKEEVLLDDKQGPAKPRRRHKPTERGET